MKKVLSMVVCFFTLSAYGVFAQECTVDEDCDDGLYCTGTETCVAGSCQAGLHPCPNATCVEVDDLCTCNPNPPYFEDCEDSIFCNGDDFCFFGVCEHSGDPCPDQSLHCVEEVARCECHINAECDDDNPCTDDSCGEDGSCRYNDNEADCDDGIYCNGIDTCACGTCNHSGDPCTAPQVCDEESDFCVSNEVELLVGVGSGTIGSMDREVNIQLNNSQPVWGISVEVCDEKDYLIASSCSVSSSFDADFDCTVNELENGCAIVLLIPDGLNPNPQPIPPNPSFRTILNIGYDVGLCVTRGTPGNVDDCGIECFDVGASCSASSSDCYRLNRNQVPNCQPPPPFTCYVLNDPCLPVDTGDVWLTIEDTLVIDPEDDPLLTLISSGPFPNFQISCDGDMDCDSESVCSTDTCSGGLCQHIPSGVTVCDDGVFCTETDLCTGSECIGEGDTCGPIFLCDETADECISCFDDNDCDGVRDGSDNCVGTPNGPDGGVCTRGTSGEPCLKHCDCGVSVGYCTMTQEDSYPPGGNNCGDACECEGNFDGDEDQDGSDAATLKLDFGRSPFFNPCNNETLCKGDIDCDGDVDGTDAAIFKQDFGRSPFFNPCPNCPTDPWCVYP